MRTDARTARSTRTTAAGVLGLVAALTLSACGAGSATPGTGSDRRPSIVTSFYPLQFVTQRVAGDLAQVTNVTKPGAEPHDLELTPREVASFSDASLVVYLSGFQPSVDKAVQTEAASHALDVAPSARLDLQVGSEADPTQKVRDPHFWLDPTRLADVADSIARRLSSIDPSGAAAYTANAAALRADLTALDSEFRIGLAHCANTSVVTSHEAFGYLAQRYGLQQRGIAGLSPEAEPDARTLAEVADFVTANKVQTIYYETLVSPAIAETVAKETKARTAVLDPIEGIDDSSAARDYFGVMRADLAALRAGQPCR